MHKENWDQNTPSNSPKARGTISKLRKERVHRKEFFKSVHLMSVVLAPKFGERSHEETLTQERCARGIWRKTLASSRIRTQKRFMFLVKSKSTPLTSKRPEEREFVVDSGASMHMMSKKDLRSDELDTLRISRNPTVVLTANGEVHTNEEGLQEAQPKSELTDLPQETGAESPKTKKKEDNRNSDGGVHR